MPDCQVAPVIRNLGAHTGRFPSERKCLTLPVLPTHADRDTPGETAVHGVTKGVRHNLTAKQQQKTYCLLPDDEGQRWTDVWNVSSNSQTLVSLSTAEEMKREEEFKPPPQVNNSLLPLCFRFSGLFSW